VTPGDRVLLTRDAETGIELIRARFGGHAYDLHRHDAWLVGVTEYGVQEFTCRRALQRSTPGRAILLDPEEAHDGAAGAPCGFAYAMMYLPQAWLGAALLGRARGSEASFRATLADDPALVVAIRRAVAELAGGGGGRLTRDAALDALVAALLPQLGLRALPMAPPRDPGVAQRAREAIHAAFGEDLGVDALARRAGAVDRFHLTRSFRAAFGVTPHAYLMQTRLLAARRLLAAGEAPAAAAASTGFADQSHLGRHFRRAYGITPAAYRACCTTVPDTHRRPFA
jgi:AraC-like DNA-binding protein